MAVEILLILLTIGNICRRDPSAEELFFRNDPGSEYGTGVYLDDTVSSGRLESEETFLEKGIYHIELSYQSNCKENNDMTAVLVSTDDVSEEKSAHLIDSDRVPLLGALESRTWTVSVHEKTAAKVVVNLHMKDHGYYCIADKAVITPDLPATALHLSSRYLFLFILLDLIVWICLFRKEAFTAYMREHAVAMAGLSCIYFLTVYMFLMHGTPHGVDLPYHLRRINFLAQGLRYGPWPVRIHPGWSNGYGYAASIGYADLFLIPSAILRLLGYSLNAAYRFYILYIVLISVLVSYTVTKKLAGGNTETGLVLCCVYELCGYHLMMLQRAQLGMFTAYAFLPAVFYLVREILLGRCRKWPLLCLVLSCIIQSHVLSTAMTGLFVILSCLVFVRKALSGKIFLTLLKTLVCTACMNLFYLLPLADSMLHQDFNGSFEGYLWGSAAPLTQFLTYNVSKASFHLEGIAGGGISFLILLFAILCDRLYLEDGKEVRQESTGLILLLSLSVFLAFCGRFYYTIYRFSKTLYQACKVLEFPWRFTSIIMALVICISAISFNRLIQRFGLQPMRLLMIMIAVLTLTQASGLIARMAGQPEPVHTYDGSIYSKTKIFEFYIKDSDLNRTFTERTIGTESEYITADITAQYGTGLYAMVNNATGSDSDILIPRWAYNGYTAETEDGRRLAVVRGDNNRVQVTVPANYLGQIHVFYREPALWRISELISVIAFIFCFYEAKQQKKASLKVPENI